MENTTHKSSNLNLKTLVSGIIVLAVIAGAIVFSTMRPTLPVKNTDTASNQVIDISAMPYTGKADAPLVVSYWYDYQCPFCKQFEEQIIRKLKTDYVDTGKMKIVWRDFQFLGPDSTSTGLIARAVWETTPEKFYEWHEEVYKMQDEENAGWGNKEDVLILTSKMGINRQTIENLLLIKNKEYQQNLENDRKEGSSLGVRGTPTLTIGKDTIIGFQSYEELKIKIDSLLNTQ